MVVFQSDGDFWINRQSLSRYLSSSRGSGEGGSAGGVEGGEGNRAGWMEGGSSVVGDESGKKSAGWRGETGEGDVTQRGLIGEEGVASEGEAEAAGTDECHSSSGRDETGNGIG